MDYKYIEQLMDRYWEGQTSQEEERLLQVFFQQKQLPAHLAKYKDLFLYTDAQRETSLGYRSLVLKPNAIHGPSACVRSIVLPPW